jgi:hypothetical protein
MRGNDAAIIKSNLLDALPNRVTQVMWKIVDVTLDPRSSAFSKRSGGTAWIWSILD